MNWILKNTQAGHLRTGAPSRGRIAWFFFLLWFFFFSLCNVYSHHPISGRKGTFTDLQSREFFICLESSRLLSGGVDVCEGAHSDGTPSSIGCSCQSPACAEELAANAPLHSRPLSAHAARQSPLRIALSVSRPVPGPWEGSEMKGRKIPLLEGEPNAKWCLISFAGAVTGILPKPGHLPRLTHVLACAQGLWRPRVCRDTWCEWGGASCLVPGQDQEFDSS